MIYLIYEKQTGRVISHLDVNDEPTVMNHHAVLQSDTIPDYQTVKVIDGKLVKEIDTDYFESCKRRVIRKINDARDLKLKSGVTTSYGVIQADLSSRINISNAVNAAALGSSDFTIEWRLADNDFVTLDAQQMIDLGQKVTEFTNTIYSQAFTLKDKIKTITNLDDLNNLEITFT